MNLTENAPIFVACAGTCPSSHPVRIPQLFVEVDYQIEEFVKHAGSGVKTTDFLLSTGDRCDLRSI